MMLKVDGDAALKIVKFIAGNLRWMNNFGAYLRMEVNEQSWMVCILPNKPRTEQQDAKQGRRVWVEPPKSKIRVSPQSNKLTQINNPDQCDNVQ